MIFFFYEIAIEIFWFLGGFLSDPSTAHSLSLRLQLSVPYDSPHQSRPIEPNSSQASVLVVHFHLDQQTRVTPSEILTTRSDAPQDTLE